MPIISRSTVARRGLVESTMWDLKANIQAKSWIASANHYCADVIQQLRVPPKTASHHRDLAQYITASTVLHAHDAWSYLGRAISCLLAGDVHRSLHLGYYAELRASMSLLAGSGIGIFNYDHFEVTAKDRTQALGVSKGTHEVAWMALRAWSGEPAAGELFAELVRPGGITLKEWFAPIGGATTIAAQAGSWFRSWGMDLEHPDEDRKARNKSSYRPDGVPTAWTIAPPEVLDFICDTWTTLEPGSGSTFDQLDRFLLRYSLEALHRGLFGARAQTSEKTYLDLVQRMVKHQGFSVPVASQWTNFLLRKALPSDPKIFTYASKDPESKPTDALAVISRAVLLLRVATGSASDLLSKSGIDSDALEFWWSEVGASRGLWEPDDPPRDLIDLWQDVRDVLDDVSALMRSRPRELGSIKGLAFGMSGRLHVLSSHERVGLWAMCPS